jgi:hypothetical protein
MTTELHRLIWDVLEIMTRSESVDLRYLKYIYLGPGNIWYFEPLKNLHWEQITILYIEPG